ncbi:cysteine desulfurase NifS [candidate division KSB1 bacterium 4572_119]|nr:MAG: cysteine desulfurase NifS [candidate division KSB1 bacterium 4572_119]
MKKIYFDHSATTPVDEKVIEVMIHFLREGYGNASSFESDNMAILGAARELSVKGKHIITSQLEHHAVLHTCQQLEKEGFKITYIKPDQFGMIQPQDVAKAITNETILISIMHANNEVGTINPINEIGEIAQEKKVLFHTDAVQSFGKLPINLAKFPVDMLTMSGHKIYGPKGTGILYVRQGIKLKQVLFGGAHEKNRRPGTENIPGIIGLAKAVEICSKSAAEEDKIKALRDKFYQNIINKIPRVRLNGHPENRLAGLLNLTFEGIEGEALLLSLDLKGVAASSGSACTSGAVEPSHVLLSMGVKPEFAQSSIRFSLGRSNTMEDVEYTSEILVEIVERLRQMSPFG